MALLVADVMFIISAQLGLKRQAFAWFLNMLKKQHEQPEWPRSNSSWSLLSRLPSWFEDEKQCHSEFPWCGRTGGLSDHLRCVLN